MTSWLYIVSISVMDARAFSGIDGLSLCEIGLCTEDVILAGLAALSLFISYIAFRFYKQGSPWFVRVSGEIYHRFHRVWPAFVFVHTSWAILIASALVYVAFIPYTDRLIVNVTAVYATVLFLQSSLRKEVPLLKAEFKDSPPWSKEEDTALVDSPDDKYVIKQELTIKNVGDAAADNLTVKCRAVCPSKGVTKEWERVKFGDEKAPSVPKNDSVRTEVVLDSFDDYNGQVYYTEVRAKPNVRQGHLTTRAFHLTEPRNPEEE
ncbi:hypothetical protein EGH22_20400 [Halomicroarcula sp. F28]|uniref:hypothetical protein n=1 Tax=Haloarcula salinisoli TaxID=2487746 RepID=UPI001C735247|nr:hypothetical protein [Halomicroarcula salinisoli]MBX0288695.1 hypothetical protein [Halomicroarcula salinisoli]